MELFERGTALGQLHTLLDEVAAGQGRLAIVAGEAGIGKTVLLQQFCRSVRDRADVLVGACDPLSTPTPLGPLLDIAPALGGELEDLLREAAPVQRIFGALPVQLGSGAAESTVSPALLNLSPREREVVVLVAQACTNREIAEHLVISERTAERHVQNGLNRLGLRSRIQVAARAMQNGVGVTGRP